MKVIGIQRNVSFKYDGNDFSGANLFTSEIRNDVEGVLTQKFFINSTKPCYEVVKSLKVGDEISISFNRFGKPEGIQKL